MSVKRMITIKLLLNSVDFFLSPFVNNTCQNMKIKQICQMYKTFVFYQPCCIHEIQQLYPIKTLWNSYSLLSRAWPPIFWWLAFQRPPTWALCPTGPEVQPPPRPFLILKDWMTSWSASLPTFLLMLSLNYLVVRAITYDMSTPVSFLILTSGSTCDYH